MIILMGPMADPVLANVCARLAVRNADLMLVHPESEGQDWDVSWSTGGGMVAGRIRLGRRVIDADLRGEPPAGSDMAVLTAFFS